MTAIAAAPVATPGPNTGPGAAHLADDMNIQHSHLQHSTATHADNSANRQSNGTRLGANGVSSDENMDAEDSNADEVSGESDGGISPSSNSAAAAAALAAAQAELSQWQARAAAAMEAEGKAGIGMTGNQMHGGGSVAALMYQPGAGLAASAGMGQMLHGAQGYPPHGVHGGIPMGGPGLQPPQGVSPTNMAAMFPGATQSVLHDVRSMLSAASMFPPVTGANGAVSLPGMGVSPGLRGIPVSGAGTPGIAPPFPGAGVPMNGQVPGSQPAAAMALLWQQQQQQVHHMQQQQMSPTGYQLAANNARYSQAALPPTSNYDNFACTPILKGILGQPSPVQNLNSVDRKILENEEMKSLYDRIDPNVIKYQRLRDKTPEQLSQHRERREKVHQISERKRRHNIQVALNHLQDKLPHSPNDPKSKVVKQVFNTRAVTLSRASAYIEQLESERSALRKTISHLKDELGRMNNEISQIHRLLPSDQGVMEECISDQTHAIMRQQFQSYVTEKSQKCWQFFIFSHLARKFFESYISAIRLHNFDTFAESVNNWISRDCTMLTIRTAVTESLTELSVKDIPYSSASTVNTTGSSLSAAAGLTQPDPTSETRNNGAGF